MGLEIDFVWKDDVEYYAGTIENQEDLKNYVDGGLDLFIRGSLLAPNAYGDRGFGRPANKVGFLFRLKEACEQACLLTSRDFINVSDFTISFNWPIDNPEPKEGDFLRINFCKTHHSAVTGSPRIFANLQVRKDTVETDVDFTDSRGDCSFTDILEYTRSLINKICTLRITSTITGEGQVVEHYNKKLQTNIDTKEKFIEFVRKGLPLQWIEHKKVGGEEPEDQPDLDTKGYKSSSIEVGSKHKLLRQLNSLISKEILPKKGIPESEKWQIEAGNVLYGCFDVNPYVYFWHMENSPIELIFWIGDWRVIVYFPNRPEDYLRWISEEMVITDEDE